MKPEDHITAPIFGISRLRLGTDGKGITTLVTFMGCPLNCKYCLNPKCHESVYEDDSCTPRKGIQILTPAQLYDIVKIDNIYFCATGGGICFGGGEPGLHSAFINDFRKLCGDKWKITIETCLHYGCNIINELTQVVDYWIIDIKSLDDSIFKKYTGKSSCWILQNLYYIGRHVDKENVTIKIPIIQGYTTDEIISHSKSSIEFMSFHNIEIVNYVKRISNGKPLKNDEI